MPTILIDLFAEVIEDTVHMRAICDLAHVTEIPATIDHYFGILF